MWLGVYPGHTYEAALQKWALRVQYCPFTPGIPLVLIPIFINAIPSPNPAPAPLTIGLLYPLHFYQGVDLYKVSP